MNRWLEKIHCALRAFGQVYPMAGASKPGDSRAGSKVPTPGAAVGPRVDDPLPKPLWLSMSTKDAAALFTSTLPTVVASLPAETPTTTFTVSWSGSDDAGRSGIASFDVFVSTDSGSGMPFLMATTHGMIGSLCWQS